MASMDGPMPIQTYILRRDQYHKSYPPLLEHPYDYKVHAAQPALVYIHSVIASSQLVEKELYALNLKFLECHCFTRHNPDIKPQYRYPVISISATGHPDHFTSAVKVIWRKLANCRKDEFMQKLVVEIYDRALMTSRERFEISESVAVEAGLSPLPAGLQRFRKQLNAWVQFTPCLMYAHCSASTEDNKPIPTLLVRCLHNKTADFAKQLNQMVVRANALAAAEKEKPKLPEPVELGLDYGEEMTWLEYYVRFRTPGVEMRYAQRMHRLEKSAAAAAAASTSSTTEAEAEIWHPYHPRTHFPPTLPSRQSAIPSHCTILGSLGLPFPIDLREVFEQEEEDQWSTIDATEATRQRYNLFMLYHQKAHLHFVLKI
ncbi:unnamed protein product [Aureobasidium pullulans]|nr:unnamed protein product [Aureobasidium pullulans]